MDNLDLDAFEDYDCSQDSNSSFSSQEGISSNYYDNSITYYDQSQFAANYNPNMAPFESQSFRNQIHGVASMDSSSSNLTPVYYNNSNNNMSMNMNLNFGFNSSGYMLTPTWQPSMQVQEFSQVNGSSFGFPNTSGSQGEFPNMVASYGNIVSNQNVQFQNQVTLPPVHFSNVATGSALTSSSTCNFVAETGENIEPPPSVSSASSVSSVASSDELEKKLAQKRERNRIAARKCRDKKLNRIKTLQAKISALNEENLGHEEEITILMQRKDQLRMMLANLAFSQIGTSSDTLTKS